jgi:phosphatidylethanolamine/phosphatidyl-N-methylethanolamine N-methyltransferase
VDSQKKNHADARAVAALPPGVTKILPSSGRMRLPANPLRKTIHAMVYEYAKFFKVFLRAPALTSAIVPSSPWLAERMIENVQLAEAKVVVELGPGTGAFTRAIQKEISPSAFFLAVEIDPMFAGHLKRQFPRAHVINDSAARLDEHLRAQGHESADCVLSGLPWAGFSGEEQQRVLSAVVRALRPGGLMTTYAYNHTAWLPGGRRFRKLLESTFSDVSTTRTEWRNLPPAFVYRCRK